MSIARCPKCFAIGAPRAGDIFRFRFRCSRATCDHVWGATDVISESEAIDAVAEAKKDDEGGR